MPEYQLYIAGQFCDAEGGKTADSINPATEEPWARVARASRKDTQRAIAAARRAFDEGPWPRMSQADRAKILNQVADGLEARSQELAAVETHDSGGTIRKTSGDMMMGAAQLRYFAEMAPKLPLWEEIQVPQFPAQSKNYLQREPIGVCGQIIPWNFPLEMAVDGSLFGCFFHQGQACESGTRLFVSEKLHDEVVGRLVERTKPLTVGDPMDFATCQGPLISARQRETVLGYIKKGVDEGAKVAVGGKRPEHLAKGYYVEPTIFVDVKNNMTIAQEEIFGPVLCVLRYKTIDDAIRMANDSIYGLGGAVWSRDKEKALVVAKQMRTGTVWVNEYHLLSVAAPFGGYKQSGIGREFGLEGILEYTEVKHVHVDQVDNRGGKFWYGALFGA